MGRGKPFKFTTEMANNSRPAMAFARPYPLKHQKEAGRKASAIVALSTAHRAAD